MHTNASVADELPPVLSIKNVTKRFGPHAALNNVSFSVGQKEIVALLGDNGAGKSTLIKCLVGLHKPDTGTITIDGKATSIRSPAHAQELGIGVVYQDLALFDNLGAAENLWAGHELTRPERAAWLGLLRKREMTQNAKDTFERLEVRIPNQRMAVGLMSGGQRQAIAVAKAVAFATRLVLLDEPTSALGVRERGNVLNMIRRLRDHNTSVVLISHNLEDVMAVADRVVVLRQGVKVGEAEPSPANHAHIVSMIVGAAAQ